MLAEGLLRLFRPNDTMGAGTELAWMRANPRDLRRFFTIDPEFGFRPILGNDLYSGFGTKRNSYPLGKRPGVERLLFIGDSVTDRGRIVEALRHEYGDDRFEYWNAGVESFNTVQEVDYYLRYNRAIRPDHVILTFHLNDFETTPIAFYNGDRLVVHAPKTRSREINGWWYRHSRLYRLVLAAKIARERRGRDAIAEEVEEKLVELRNALNEDGVRLTVLVLPQFKPYAEWTPFERACRERILKVAERQGIRHFDLLAAMNEAIEKGIDVQETRGDFWHPSEGVAIALGESLHRLDIFGP